MASSDGASDASRAKPNDGGRDSKLQTGRVTIPDLSHILGDPVVEYTVQKLIATAGRLAANRKAPGSRVTAPYGTVDDTGRVQLSR